MSKGQAATHINAAKELPWRRIINSQTDQGITLLGTFATEAWIQVQRDFLFRADIQLLLGFHLMQVEPSGKTTDLLGARNQSREDSEECVTSAKQPASDPEDQQPPGENGHVPTVSH